MFSDYCGGSAGGPRLGHICKHEVKKSLSHDQHWAFIQGLSGIWPDDNQGSEVGNADPGSCFHQ